MAGYYRASMPIMLAAMAWSALAAAEPVTLAGGALDPAYPTADVYLRDPAEPKVPAGRACRTAKTYVDYHKAGRFSDVPSLFADDAILLEPSRLNVRGRDGIRHFYEMTIGTMKPQITAVHYQGDATDCLVELAVRQNLDGKMRYRLASMDHFTVDRAGRIIRMVAFQRPSSLAVRPPELRQ